MTIGNGVSFVAQLYMPRLPAPAELSHNLSAFEGDTKPSRQQTQILASLPHPPTQPQCSSATLPNQAVALQGNVTKTLQNHLGEGQKEEEGKSAQRQVLNITR